MRSSRDISRPIISLAYVIHGRPRIVQHFRYVGRTAARAAPFTKADRKTPFFGYQHSLKDIIMWEAILNHMVPLMTIYSQPIRPQFDLNKCGRGDSNSRDEWSITFSILVVVQILVALPLLNRPCCVDYFFDGPCSSYGYRDIIYCSKRLISVIL